MTAAIQAHCNIASIVHVSISKRETKQPVERPSDSAEKLPGNFAAGFNLITLFYYTIKSGVAQIER